MKNILTFAVAVAALSFFGSQQASAQSYNNGYQFGTGVNQSFRGGSVNRFGGGFFGGFNQIGILDRAQAPPYFAQFPPVYYNGIVRRPYGISPFAAPPGIEPVELRQRSFSLPPVTIKNPYFNPAKPASGPAMKSELKATEKKTNQST